MQLAFLAGKRPEFPIGKLPLVQQSVQNTKYNDVFLVGFALYRPNYPYDDDDDDDDDDDLLVLFMIMMMMIIIIMISSYYYCHHHH